MNSLDMGLWLLYGQDLFLDEFHFPLYLLQYDVCIGFNSGSNRPLFYANKFTHKCFHHTSVSFMTLNWLGQE